MATDHEIALVRALSSGTRKEEIYWIFSRTQVEFILKDLDRVDSSDIVARARYQEMILPVLSLEKHFAIAEGEGEEGAKYMVLRAVDETKKLRRLIISNGFSPQFHVPDSSFSPLPQFKLPAHSEHILGAYSLGDGKVGVVPDIVSISRALD